MTFRWGEALKGGVPGEGRSGGNLAVMAAPLPKTAPEAPKAAPEPPKAAQEGCRPR